MSLLDAIHTVLSEAAQPLDGREIVKRLVARKLWSTQGKRLESTVVSYLGRAIRKDDSRFQRAGRGLYATKPTGDAEIEPEPIAPMSFVDAARA